MGNDNLNLVSRPKMPEAMGYKSANGEILTDRPVETVTKMVNVASV